MEVLEELMQQFDPSNFELIPFLKFTLIACAGCALLGVILHIIFGKRSSINQSVSSAVGILMLYFASIALFILGAPYDRFVSPLPFVSFVDQYLSVFVLEGAEFGVLCTKLVEMLMLAFLVNLIDHFVPKGNGFFSWLILRIVSVALALVGQLVITWVFTAILPDVLVLYAPMILLALLVLLLAVSIFKLVVGVLLGATMGPVVGAIYTFFVSNVIGKQIVKAAVTTAIMVGVVALMNHFGFHLIALSTAALIGFLPAIVLLILVWFLIYKLL